MERSVRTAATARPRERGFALLVVIWVLALLAVLATGFAADTRSEAQQARNLLENARAQALAEAGIALAVTGLLDRNPVTQWAADGTPRDLTFDGGRLHIVVQDEGGKVNLNTAAPELLSGLLARVGVAPGERDALVDAIMTRRQLADAAAQAPSSALLAAGGGEPPPAFEAIDELRLLPAVSRAVFDAVAPYVTVFSRGPRVNTLTAPKTVLLSLPNVNPQEVDAVLAARSAIAAGQISTAIPFLTGVDRFIVRTTLRAAMVTVTATTARGAVFVRQALLFLTGKPDRPYEFLDWRQAVARSG
ncbi:MAG TPA: hypothetical protein VMC10_06630 [Stellaceae bacterium]|nr:hypothetical protein [Stellaceae bacterium]